MLFHTVVEHVVSMRAPHRDAILWALGGLPGTDHAAEIGAREWVCTPRKGLLSSFLPAVPTAGRPARRATPWTRGRGLRWDGENAVMLRSRGTGDELGTPTYQYHPKHLLYRTGSAWLLGGMASASRRIVGLAPAAVRPGLAIIWRALPGRNMGGGGD